MFSVGKSVTALVAAAQLAAANGPATPNPQDLDTGAARDRVPNNLSIGGQVNGMTPAAAGYTSQLPSGFRGSTGANLGSAGGGTQVAAGHPEAGSKTSGPPTYKDVSRHIWKVEQGFSGLERRLDAMSETIQQLNRSLTNQDAALPGNILASLTSEVAAARESLDTTKGDFSIAHSTVFKHSFYYNLRADVDEAAGVAAGRLLAGLAVVGLGYKAFDRFLSRKKNS